MIMLIILAGQLGTTGVGWRPCSKDTGTNFVSKLANTLWYLDPHHNKLSKCGIHLPEHFLRYNGYSDFKRKKEKEPRLSNEGIKQHIEQLKGASPPPTYNFGVVAKDHISETTVAISMKQVPI